MDAKQVMARLENLGTEQTRKTYRRHGYVEPMYGVLFGDLGALKKKIKTDHKLALDLWKTGNADARILATMVADPKQFDPAMAEKWAQESNFPGLTDYVGCIAGESPDAVSLATRWAKSTDPKLRRTARSIVATRLRDGAEVPRPLLASILADIEKRIHTEENWTRYAMMYGLIAIGSYEPSLTAEAIAAARRIGKVDFDPEETSCKMPDPIPYINKTVAHLKKRGKGK